MGAAECTSLALLFGQTMTLSASNSALAPPLSIKGLDFRKILFPVSATRRQAKVYMAELPVIAQRVQKFRFTAWYLDQSLDL